MIKIYTKMFVGFVIIGMNINLHMIVNIKKIKRIMTI